MPKKILLADDSITIQKVVELTFSDGDYEVTAVNNGAKAVQKLSEMRPDIILSDIIMPEKNGYEVCEYVKSHPEFRSIPVVLLTGTFEPFDPDRAEKAGCDAVVTKPFESQSLIHKVEELIAQAQPAAIAAPPASVAEAASPWMDDTASGDVPAAPMAFTHDADIFSSAPPQATTEMFDVPPPPPSSSSPFGDEPTDAFAGETRAFPRMTFEEMSQMAAASTPEPAPEPPPAPEPSPWDEPAQFSGETRAFEKISFDDFPAPPPAPEPEAESPFGAPPAPEQFSSETRAFTKMSLEELQQMSAAQTLPREEPVAPATSSWDPEPPAFAGGETRAFPKLDFDSFQSTPTPIEEPPVEAPVESSWEPPAFSSEPEPPAFASAPEADSPFASDDAPAFGGETRAFPKLSFDDFQQMASAAQPSIEAQQEPESEPEPEAIHTIAWSPAPEPEAESPFSAPAAFDEPEPEPEPVAASPFAESLRESLPEPIEEMQASEEIPAGYSDAPIVEDMQPPADEMPFGTEPAAEAVRFVDEPESFAAASAPEALPEVEPEPEPAPQPIAARETAEPLQLGGSLTDDQVDRIARRVVELISDQVVRKIAWEVIPDLAEMVVKERIRQLEAEA